MWFLGAILWLIGTAVLQGAEPGWVAEISEFIRNNGYLLMAGGVLIPILKGLKSGGQDEPAPTIDEAPLADDAVPWNPNPRDME